MTRTRHAQEKTPHLCGVCSEQQTFHLPVPVSFEVCGLLSALSLTSNVPVLVPVSVGVNTTLIVQGELAARLDVHVVVETVKSPLVVIAILVSATFSCLFVSVNTTGKLLLPTFTIPNVLLAGVSVACGAPVPVSGTVCGLFEALSVIVTLPLRVPS